MGDNSELLQFQINMVSARDLASVTKSMETYAVVYINPEQKMTSRVDPKGHNCPEWNEKFTFWVVPPILYSDHCTVVIEIYARSWIRDTLVGSVTVPAHQIVPANPSAQNHRAVALQIRRPSGRPQGILNIAVSLLEDTSMMSMPLSGVGGDDPKSKPKGGPGSTVRRVKSDRSSMVGPDEDRSGPIGPHPTQCGSMCSSDVGPSASVVAAAVARGLYPPPSTKGKRKAKAAAKDDGESSILQWADEETEEAMRAKIERWKTELGMTNAGDGEGARRHHRRRGREGQGKGKAFKCFGNAYGFEFTIVCGGNGDQGNGKVHNKRMKRAVSDRSSYVDL